MVLAYLQAQQPSPPEAVQASNVVTGVNVEVQQHDADQRFWQLQKTHHAVDLIFSPAYGAALAGGLLAVWRAVTKRLGFPVQPGHWLLLVLAIKLLLMFARPHLQAMPLPADTPDLVITLIMAAVIGTVMVDVCEPLRWWLMLGLALFAHAIMCLAFILRFLSSSNEVPSLFVVGAIAMALVPIAALVCALLDLAERERYDFFHWVGVATFLGVAAHLSILMVLVWNLP